MIKQLLGFLTLLSFLMLGVFLSSGRGNQPPTLPREAFAETKNEKTNTQSSTQQKRTQSSSSAKTLSKGAKQTTTKSRQPSKRSKVRRLRQRSVVARPGSRIPTGRVIEIQNALIGRGFLQGKPTGVYDEQTIAAMKRFQQAENIEVTGYPTAQSLHRLGLHPNAANHAPNNSGARPPGIL